MSILIKGMKMPKACMNGGCPIDGKYCDLWWKAGGGEYGRHRDCPLVELPDHGDLIDRDVAYSHALRIWLRNSNGNDAMEELLNKLREEFPVVIPAERREE